MKRLIFFITLVILAFNTIAPTYATDKTNITVKVDGKVVSFPDENPCIENNRTFVPARFVSTALGASVDWIDSTGTAIMKKGSKEIQLKLGDNKATVDGKEVTLDAKTFTRNGRAFVPLRFISETLGTTVDWFGDSKTIVINSTDKGIVRLYDRLLQSGEYDYSSPDSKETIVPKDNNFKILIGIMHEDQINDRKIPFGDIAITVLDYSKYTRNKIKELLNICYPTKHETVYKYFMDTLKENLWENINADSQFPGISDIYVDNRFLAILKDTNNARTYITIGLNGAVREKSKFRYKLTPGENPYIQEEIDRYDLNEE